MASPSPLRTPKNRFEGLFLRANESMWSVFEPELGIRVIDLPLAAGFRDRVRACLIEILASG